VGESTAIIRAGVGIPIIRGWHRWPTEPDEAWHAFTKFREQRPPRRLKAIIGYPTAECAEWYRNFAWAERAREYDEYLQGILDAEIEDSLRNRARGIAAQHLQILAAARILVARQIDKYVDMDQDGDHPVLKPAELTKLMEAVIKYDRLTQGESTENIDVKHDDLSNLSIDELRQLRAIRLKVGG
jgi:hypothetical protein